MNDNEMKKRVLKSLIKIEHERVNNKQNQTQAIEYAEVLVNEACSPPLFFHNSMNVLTSRETLLHWKIDTLVLGHLHGYSLLKSY